MNDKLQGLCDKLDYRNQEFHRLKEKTKITQPQIYKDKKMRKRDEDLEDEEDMGEEDEEDEEEYEDDEYDEYGNQENQLDA